MPTLNRPESVPPELREELKETFGFVPSFARTTTPGALKLWWGGMRDFEMSDKTALPAKTKELIGLGVSAQIPCHYCVLFHTEAARLNGATETEIQEAIFQASLTRQGSTILNGSQLDQETFSRELDQIVDYLKTKSAEGPRGVVAAPY